MFKLTKNSNFNVLLFILIIICLLIFGFLFYNFLQSQTISSPMQTQITAAQTQTEITPTPTKSQSTQISPDGLFELTLDTEIIEPNRMSYMVSVTEAATGNHLTVFRDTVTTQTNITIPFNTWSADNKYFFITLQNGTEQKNLIFKSSGELIDEAAYINVNTHYVEKEISYEFDEMTGWASQSLLVIKTNKTDGSGVGTSYWFDVTSKNFIQLSSQF